MNFRVVQVKSNYPMAFLDVIYSNGDTDKIAIPFPIDSLKNMSQPIMDLYVKHFEGMSSLMTQNSDKGDLKFADWCVHGQNPQIPPAVIVGMVALRDRTYARRVKIEVEDAVLQSAKLWRDG